MLKFRLGKNFVLGFSFVAAAFLCGCNSEVSESVNISGIEVSSVPKKINYKNGEKLNLSGLEVKRNMTDGSSKILLPEEYSVDPAEGSVLKENGSMPVKIVSEGKTAFFPVYVEKPEVIETEKTFSVGLEISGLPEKKDYKIGESLNLAGLAVKMNKSDGTSVVLKEAEYTVEPAAGTLLEEEGSVPVKISSEGKTAFFTVYVGKLSLKRLRIVSFPEKTYYLSDEVFKIDGLSVMCDFDNGTSKELSYGEYYISVLNGESLNDGFGQKITVSYGNVSAFFIINVSPSWDSAVIVDDGSHKIPLSKFNEAKNLRTVTIPDTIEEIGAQAFYKCVSLEEITLPASLKKIDRRAFYGCSSLKKIVIPDDCRVGEEAFSDCISVTELKFEGRWSAEKKCFANLVKLESLDLSGFSSDYMNVEDAFQGCAGLSEITIPEGVHYIGDGMFSDCTGLTKITIPDSVNTIGDMFRGCIGLTSVELPNSVSSIGGGVFEGCTGLTSIEIPNSVSSIGDWAFSGCTGLTSVEIPDSVTSIAGSAFKGCTGLTSIEIPNSVTSIDDSAFFDCISLLTISYQGTMAEFKAIDVISYCWSLAGKTIKCSDGDFIYSYD